MPYCFGVAGGAVVTDRNGAIQLCASGDGRAATHLLYNLNLCELCSRNVHFQDAVVGASKIGDTNTVLAFTKSNSAKNLRGT